MKSFFRWMGRGLKQSWNATVSFFKGVIREGKRVRWPSKTDMKENTATVVLFSAFFALVFSAFFTIGQAILSALGYFD